MKIELDETEIAQAIVDWLSQSSIIRNTGPYDVKFDRPEDGPIKAIVTPGEAK